MCSCQENENEDSVARRQKDSVVLRAERAVMQGRRERQSTVPCKWEQRMLWPEQRAGRCWHHVWQRKRTKAKGKRIVMTEKTPDSAATTEGDGVASTQEVTTTEGKEDTIIAMTKETNDWVAMTKERCIDMTEEKTAISLSWQAKRRQCSCHDRGKEGGVTKREERKTITSFLRSVF